VPKSVAMKKAVVAKSSGLELNTKSKSVSHRRSTTPNGSGFFSNMIKRGSGDDPWEEHCTANGMTYYYNSITKKISSDKPDGFKNNSERGAESGEWYWVPDDSEAWIPVMIKNKSLQSSQGGFTTATTVTGLKRKVNIIESNVTNNLVPLRKSALFRLHDDLVLLDDINPGLLLHVLKERYANDQVYTWIGITHNILISINPFKLLSIYDVQTMNKYANPNPGKVEPPHTYAVAQSCYYDLNFNKRNQAILISGESGAGKTEVTKQCFHYLAEVAGSETGCEQRILCANPILEAFGNARTVRNDNSSRFGRWTEIHFTNLGRVSGASVVIYLLEKSRVVV